MKSVLNKYFKGVVFMSMSEMSPADIAALTGNNNNRSNDGFGSDFGGAW